VKSVEATIDGVLSQSLARALDGLTATSLTKGTGLELQGQGIDFFNPVEDIKLGNDATCCRFCNGPWQCGNCNTPIYQKSANI